jgi:hypothetical protein
MKLRWDEGIGSLLLTAEVVICLVGGMVFGILTLLDASSLEQDTSMRLNEVVYAMREFDSTGTLAASTRLTLTAPGLCQLVELSDTKLVLSVAISADIALQKLHPDVAVPEERCLITLYRKENQS